MLTTTTVSHTGMEVAQRILAANPVDPSTLHGFLFCLLAVYCPLYMAFAFFWKEDFKQAVTEVTQDAKYALTVVMRRQAAKEEAKEKTSPSDLV